MTLHTVSSQEAIADGLSVAIGGAVGVGITLADATVGGVVKTHVDGDIESADSVLLMTSVDTRAAAYGEANGGAIGAGVNGTDVDARITTAVQTYVGGGTITATNDVTLTTLVATDASAVSGACCRPDRSRTASRRGC